MVQKKITRINRDHEQHWVGDGFPVSTMFSYHDMANEISPFLLLDYAGPAEFPPATKPRGVGEHPHRGFETVTIVYQGEVQHRDNAGHAGQIGPGDVQWMTAAKGILHEEMHSDTFTQKGGMMEMIQLWVNLPAQHKMSAPHYQEINKNKIPTIPLDNNSGTLRVIAGDYKGHTGAAKTFTPVNLWDIQLQANHRLDLTLPPDFNASIFLRRGHVIVNDTEALLDRQLAVLSRDGTDISIHAKTDSTLLLMSGKPIDEPISGYGPFVMNTEEEIRKALSDFRAGLF